MSDAAILVEFVVESQEGLDLLDRELVALEQDPRDTQRIGAIFRVVHTIKGTAGFLGFSRLEALAHTGESLLALLRDQGLPMTVEVSSVLLRFVDRTRAVLRLIETQGNEGEQDHADLMRELAGAKPGAKPAAKEEQPVAAAEAAPAHDGPAASDSNVRVDVGLLDKLMNLVGELVLSRNQLLQVGMRIDDPAFAGAAQRLNLVTTELQEQIMKTRMQPIGNVWSKLPRVVRDVASACGKQVRVEMSGKETELDRTVLEAIKDPLTHIVRNAIDHGIENGDVRAQRGKSRTGTLRLRAYHEGGQVNIEVGDDGGGLNHGAIRKKAVERGMLAPDAVIDDHALAQFIFAPGFSTAAAVTKVSGRGVGMDVVKTNIEKIGGTVDIASNAGAGTTVKIRIPLTLAIVPAVIVSSAGQRFAIPQANLLELVRLLPEQAAQAIETVGGAPLYRLRGQLLPLVDLNQTLKLRADRDGSVNIIVLQADDSRFGLVVDEVGDPEEIVVKPLGAELKSLNVYAGATIMGDGHVALIIDVSGLAQHTDIVAKNKAKTEKRVVHAEDTASAGEQRQTLLLFGVDDVATLAVPLTAVARLEEFSADRIERLRDGFVVQYRGEILPLKNLTQAPIDQGQVQVIVHEGTGFVVGKILDVVDAPVIDQRAIVNGRVTEIVSL